MESKLQRRIAPADARLDEMEAEHFGKPPSGWRRSFYEVIFESGSRTGKLFDEILIVAILISVAAVLLDSVPEVSRRHGTTLAAVEWFFTVIFTVEYVARLACVRRPRRYALSFFGVVDLLSVLPTYLAFFFPGLHALIDVRVLRLLRVFRIFKLSAYIGEYRLLGAAIAASRRKILVFLSVVLMIVLIVGTLMYLVEGPASGFTDIPTSVYWAIVTLTTVGFGDITPHTALGRVLASMMMLIGWGILAVPTGIVTAEMTAQRFGLRPSVPRACRSCGVEGHEQDARYCRGCGASLSADARL